MTSLASMGGAVRRASIRLLATLVLCVLGSHLSTRDVHAADGELLTTFGAGTGFVTTNFGGGLLARGSALATQSDRKIVVVGGIGSSAPPQPQPSYWALARYNVDGSLDPAFGMGGRVTEPPGGFATAVAAITGKLLVAGNVPGYPAVLRYNRHDGRLDTTFGTGGISQQATSTGNRFAVVSMAVQCDGKIVIAGTRTVSCCEPSIDGFVLARFHGDGSVDTTFGNNGVALVTHPEFKLLSGPKMLVTSDAKIFLLATHSEISTFTSQAVLVRLDSTGTLDVTFGGTGVVFSDLSGRGFSSGARDLAFQGSGILVMGTFADLRTLTPLSIGLARYRADGTLDPAFGRNSSGRVTTTLRDAGANAMTVDLVDRIVVGGIRGTDSGTKSSLVRYLANGSLDREFGTAGTGLAATAVPAGFMPWVADIDFAGSVLYAAGNVGPDFMLGAFKYSAPPLPVRFKCWIKRAFQGCPAVPMQMRRCAW